jgi:hypothetical protein
MQPGGHVASPDRQAAQRTRTRAWPPPSRLVVTIQVSEFKNTTAARFAALKNFTCSAASGAVDESTVIPGGTAYVVSQLYPGETVPITLTARQLTTFGRPGVAPACAHTC